MGHSDETKMKISLAMKGKLKGRRRSKEAIEKGRASLKRAHAEGRCNGFAKGHKPLSDWTGRKHTAETKSKMRAARLRNQPMKRPEVVAKMNATKKARGSNVGERSPNWRGGITSAHVRIRNSSEYRAWRDGVFKRDDYTCQECGARCGNGADVKLNAHHIRPFATHPELRLDQSNGITLCKPCHDTKPKGAQVYAVH